MKKIIMVLMLLISIPVSLCAQENTVVRKLSPFLKMLLLTRRFYINLDDGNKLRLR